MARVVAFLLLFLAPVYTYGYTIHVLNLGDLQKRLENIMILGQGLVFCYDLDHILHIYDAHKADGWEAGAAIYNAYKETGDCRDYTGPYTVGEIYAAGVLNFHGTDYQVIVHEMPVGDAQQSAVYMMSPVPEMQGDT